MEKEIEAKAVRSKRQRSENLLEEDKIILKELVRERVKVIENKNTDANINAKKVAAWHDLHISFNNMARSSRTLQQLKAQWGILKMTAKKQKFLERKEQTRTGGGPPPASEPPPSADDIAVWLPNEFTVESNQFDSDSQNTIEKGLPKKEKLNQENPTPSPSDNIEIIEAIIEPEITVQTTPTPKIFIQKKLKNKKVGENSSASAAQLISQTEVACRKELHELQMANEKQKLKNLKLKEEVLKYKLEYYKNKLKFYGNITSYIVLFYSQK